MSILLYSSIQLPTSFPSLIDCHRVVDSQGTSHYCRLAKFVSQLISLCSRASLVLLIEQKFYHSSHLSCIKLVLCALSIVSGGKQAPRLLDYPLYSGHLSQGGYLEMFPHGTSSSTDCRGINYQFSRLKHPTSRWLPSGKTNLTLNFRLGAHCMYLNIPYLNI